MNKFKTVHVSSGGYDVLIGRGLLFDAGQLISLCRPVCKILVVTDDNVAPLWLEKVTSSLRAAGFETETMILPHGEGSKSFLLRSAWGVRRSRTDTGRHDCGFRRRRYRRYRRLPQRPICADGIFSFPLPCSPPLIRRLAEKPIDLEAGKNPAAHFISRGRTHDLDTFQHCRMKFCPTGAEVIKYGVSQQGAVLAVKANRSMRNMSSNLRQNQSRYRRSGFLRSGRAAGAEFRPYRRTRD